MAEASNTIGEQAKALWAKLSPRKKVTAIAAVTLTLVGTLALSLREETPKEAVLYSGLPPEEAGSIVKELDAAKVPYRLDHEGATILVPESRVHELRLRMATTSLPSGGGHDLNAFVSERPFGGSAFREQVSFQRALSGELARSITTVDAVERARVILALPEERLFVKDKADPSASVVLTLRRGRELNAKQIKGIVHVVSSAVERLQPKNVSVVDERGNVLWSGEDTAEAEDVQRELERTLSKRISDITERIVGRGRAVVSVTSEYDQSITERTEEFYDKDRAAVRSQTRTEELVQGKQVTPPLGTAVAGGVAGTRSNLAGTAQPEIAAPAPTGTERKKVTETQNNEISRTVAVTRGPKGQVKRLHVAVLVDGALAPILGAADASTTTTSSLAIGAKKGRTWSRAQLDQIALLAREAAGLDPSRGDRIEVHCAPFFSDEEEPLAAPPPPVVPVWRKLVEERPWVLAAIAGVALLAMMISTVVVLRRRRRAALEPIDMPALPLRAAEVDQVLAGETPAIPAPVAEPEPDVRALALEAATADPVRAARILSAWLAETPPTVTPAMPVPPPAVPAHAEGARR